VFVAEGRLRALDQPTAQCLDRQDGRSPGSVVKLWSVELGQKTEIRRSIDHQISSQPEPAVNMTYSPVTVRRCWMMSAETAFRRQTTSACSARRHRSGRPDIDSSIVVVDGEFWRPGDGAIQRYEAVSTGIGYGQRYMLPGGGNVDPSSLFAALGSMWMYRGQELIGFDIPTGSAN
jgi:hypothetical protein